MKMISIPTNPEFFGLPVNEEAEGLAKAKALAVKVGSRCNPNKSNWEYETPLEIKEVSTNRVIELITVTIDDHQFDRAMKMVADEVLN